jgi:tetratricopeptide (TPR) repeat protein
METSHSRRAILMALGAAAVMTLGVGARQGPDERPTATPSAGNPSAATPSSANQAAAAALRVRGLELGYNLDHADALAAFEEAKAADPRNPTAYRLAAATAWITVLFEQGAITVDDYLGQARANLQRSTPNAALDAAFHRSLNQALAMSEQQLVEKPSDADAHYQVGAAFGFLASYTATVEGRVLGSLGPARRAYREHERVLELDPRRKDAGLIVGMYRYAVASMPAPLRLFAHLAGFGGGRERGLRLVEEAAGYPSDVQSNAMFTLVLMYNREARYGDALRVIGELQQRYPRNRLLWLEAGNTALRAGRPAEARVALEAGLARLSRDTRPRAAGEEARWRYAYGATLVALKDAVPAERELRSALAGASRDWVRGRTRKELGKLADLAGDRARALEEYREADRLCRLDRDSDCSSEVKNLMATRYR